MQLQRHLAEFEAAGVAVYAISYDAPEVLAAFAAEFGITYPLLSDADSGVIRRYGILNTLVRPDEAVYGIPYPGSYLTDEMGAVTEKSFYRLYRVRPATRALLKDGFGVPLTPQSGPIAESTAPGVRVTVALGEEALVFQQRVPLYVTLDLDDGLHIYAPGAGGGMLGITAEVRAPDGIETGTPAFPESRPFRIEGAEEALPVFEGTIEVAVPLISTRADVEPVTLEVVVRYQACDNRQCFLPQEQRITIDLPLQGLNRARPRP
ncbi:MAG: redoxin domain-containing protein [Dehalococcoidia bacterium]|nr:MAG: redoxin domain-containing protein [Dehalococcoidia bacterium]